jgi:hypothetical protein
VVVLLLTETASQHPSRKGPWDNLRAKTRARVDAPG